MRITALLAYVFVILCCLEQLVFAIFSVRLSSLVFGEGSFLQGLFYCFSGVGAIFYIVFAILYKPFKSLSK